MPIPRELRSAWRSDNDTIDDILSTAEKQLESLLPKLRDELKSLPKDSAGRLQVEVSQELVQRILTDSGLDSYESTILESLKSANKADLGIFNALGFSSIPPAKRAVALAFQVNQVTNTFAKIRADLAFVVANRLQEMVLIPTPISQVADSIKGQVNLSKSRSISLLNTALSGFQTELARQAADSIPSKDLFYIYVGPDDSITRPFCHVLEGYAIPADLMAKLDNGTRPQLPFELFRGGYNCRHALVPATRSYIESQNIPIADMALIRKANAAARK